MWKWLGLVLTLLVLALCIYTITRVQETNARLDRILTTQEKLDERTKYIEWVVNTAPLVVIEYKRCNHGECKE